LRDPELSRFDAMMQYRCVTYIQTDRHTHTVTHTHTHRQMTMAYTVLA